MSRCLLYYITDRSRFPGNEAARRQALLDKISDAAASGVDYIQLREKDLNARELESLARQVMAVIHDSSSLRTENPEQGTKVLINSRTDIALAVGADGVHLRSDDISPAEVRGIFSSSGGDTLVHARGTIMISCHSPAEVMRAASEGVDFAVFAPVFGKSGAYGTPPAGITALREACGARIPVFALGGVTMENAASCLDAEAAGVAGIRLFQENKIEDVVRKLRSL